MTNEEEYERLQYDEDQAQRRVHELSDEIREYEEETEEWYSVLHELHDAENELTYIRHCLEDF